MRRSAQQGIRWELGLPNGLDAIDLAGGHSMQSYSDNLQAARQRNHNRQPTAARNTTVFQASGSVSLPVTIAAKTVTAANPHIKAIARLIKQTTIQRRRTICGLRARSPISTRRRNRQTNGLARPDQTCRSSTLVRATSALWRQGVSHCYAPLGVSNASQIRSRQG
jgi:hypothetical protein